jgi:PiT family inorganic phosphate transporter
METLTLLTLLAIAIVVLFDYTNGFHDAANIVATVIASRAMAPAQAVLIIGVFEFLGPLLGGTAVANTIGKFVDLHDLPRIMSMTVLVSGLSGAIVWNLITWWKGIPSSSSHALVGGLVGAVMLAVGGDHVVWGFTELFQHGHFTGVTKVLLALVLSPVAGFLVGFALHRLFSLAFRAARPHINGPLRWASTSPPPAWPSPTAPTMPRRAWASSPWPCCWAGTSPASKCPSGSCWPAPRP